MPSERATRVLFATACRLSAAALAVLALVGIVAGAGGDPRDTVRVPAGAFFMGCDESADAECDAAERPGREVSVDAFAIDRVEVSVTDYARCVAAGACSSADLTRSSRTDFNTYCTWGVAGRERHPINCIDWQQAVTYCAWAGGRLPTETEWEKAARGTDRRLFPWGNRGDALGGTLANLHQGSRVPDASPATAPVGSLPAGASPYGALDMSGNVQEWLADVDAVRERAAVRGGSWLSQPRYARTSFRAWFPLRYRDALTGVRCAR